MLEAVDEQSVDKEGKRLLISDFDRLKSDEFRLKISMFQMREKATERGREKERVNTHYKSFQKTFTIRVHIHSTQSQKIIQIIFPLNLLIRGSCGGDDELLLLFTLD